MTWFKVDDQFATSPKALAAGNAACGLWVRAGSWSAAQLTDGDIPSTIVSSLGGRAADARKLVEVGLWHSHGHACDSCPVVRRGHYLFHGWQEYQPLREEVQRKRAEARDRMSTLRQGRRVRANNEGTSVEVREPRPDPTRPVATATTQAGRRSGRRDLPPAVDILVSRLRSHTALRALRDDCLDAGHIEIITALVEKHGDQALVQVALDVTGHTPPRLVNAYIGAWQALDAARTSVHVLTDPDAHVQCAECGVPKSQHRGPAVADCEFTTERKTS